MKLRYIAVTAIGVATTLGLIAGHRVCTQPAKAVASSAIETAPIGAVSVNPFPLEYPVTDRVRSLVRFVRDEIGLTTQHMQSLGSSDATILAVLGAIRDWVLPQQDALDEIRDDYLAARSAWLNCRSKAFSLEQRMELVRQRGDDDGDGELTNALRRELAEETEKAPRLERDNESIRARLSAQIAPIAETVQGLLPPSERRLWQASRRNAPTGLPVAAWFVPDLDSRQLTLLKEGKDPATVLTPSQQVISELTMNNYRDRRQSVRQAELAFFFGRRPDAELRGTTATPVALVANRTLHGRAPEAAGDAGPSKCPLHFGRAGTPAEGQGASGAESEAAHPRD